MQFLCNLIPFLRTETISRCDSIICRQEQKKNQFQTIYQIMWLCGMIKQYYYQHMYRIKKTKLLTFIHGISHTLTLFC